MKISDLREMINNPLLDDTHEVVIAEDSREGIFIPVIESKIIPAPAKARRLALIVEGLPKPCPEYDED